MLQSLAAAYIFLRNESDFYFDYSGVLVAACAMIELNDATFSKSNQAIKAVPVQWAMEYTEFGNRAEFGHSLWSAVRWLHCRDDSELKVLIISAHGVPLTGTELDVGNGERVSLWDYRDYFSVLPPNLVIYVSACFGLFPSSEYLQSDRRNRPYVLGPLVDIKFAHANKFQDLLFRLLMTGAELPSSEELRRLISRFNEDRNLRNMHYGGREWLFAMWDKDGSFFPAESQGAQLAAPAIRKTIVTACELLFTEEDRPVPIGCVFVNEHGRLLRATLDSLGNLVEDWKDLIEMRLEITYQISKANEPIDCGKWIDRIHILKASPRKLNR